MNRLLSLGLVLLAACSSGAPSEPPAAPAAARPAPVVRDIDALQRLKLTPHACSDDAACPSGSHCDDDRARCTWACLADSDCGEQHACDAGGTCVAAAAPALAAFSAADSDACHAIPAAERRAVLLGLNDEQRVCAGDDDCPCGSFCANDATCRVECLVGEDLPPLSCQDGEVCSPIGRCAAGPADPGPQIELALAVSPTLLVANTASAPALVEAEIVVEANSLEVLEPVHPATVFVGFAERHDVTASGTLPRVKCSAGAPLAASCELAGGWSFDLTTGNLRSAPRKVWVEIPQAQSAADWTLEVRSEWADSPTSSLVRAAPVIIPPSDFGRYHGTIAWPQAGGDTLNLPVDAVVTASHVALFEPTRVLFPDGQVLLSRDATRCTMLTWLKSDVAGAAAPYQVRFDLGALAYNTSNGLLTGSISMTTRTGAEPLALQLDRIGDHNLPTCSSSSADCGAGNYCNTTAFRCLPGSGPAEGSIVPKLSSVSWPSGTLRSAQVESWQGPLATVVAANTANLGGGDVDAIERAYCFRAPGQPAPGRFGFATTEPSLDLACADGGAQPTFGYANTTREVVADAQGAETFNLLDQCLADLSVQPSGAASAANLLGGKQCVSLGRFFQTLRVNASSGFANPPHAAAQRLLTQILRQWLSVNTFTARTTVQEQQYDDVLGSGGAPVQERFGNAVDLMERGWRVLLDPTVVNQYITGFDWSSVTSAPDYRFISRPVARWSFNTPLGGLSPDAEGNFPMQMSGRFPNPTGNNNVVINESTDGVCKTTQPIALSDRGFTLVGYVAAAVNGWVTLLDKRAPNGHRFWIELRWDKVGTPNIVEVYFRDSDGGLARFVIPQAAGFYAFVAQGETMRLYRFSTGIEEFTPVGVNNGGPHWGAAGPVSLPCDVNNQVVIYDEVSLWSRPLAKETLFAMSRLYNNASGASVPANSSLPPHTPISTAPNDEQAAGLAMHLVEAASADLELVSSYLDAERGVMYDECYLGGASPARERAIGRTGRALRFVAIMEHEAAALTTAPGATSAAWYPRYHAGQVDLAGKRAKVLEGLRRASSCENPLGISEDDLPLFHGTAVGASERFFASSRFLTQQARQEINAAELELGQARSAYQQQRQSAFQVAMSIVDKAERLRKLRLDYEGTLRRYCGAPAGGQKLLDGFLDGTISASTCFFRTELPGCQNLASLPVSQVPSTCLRGELGEKILTIQAAQIDAQNASNAYDRAVGQYDAEMDYCGRRQAFNDQSDLILQKHHEHMQSLREEKRSSGLLGSFVKGVAGMAIGAMTENPAIAIGSFLELVGVAAGQSEADVAEDMDRAEADYQEVVQARSHELDLMACYHGADNQKFAIDAARDVIRRAYHDVTATMYGLENARAELAALADEAAGALAVEQSIDRTPPHHHFWLDDHIDAYRRHLRYARRLSYLALRSFEYESQQTIGLRGQVLSARRPDQLLAVMEAIEQRNAPMQGEQGFVIGETPVVLSLRDEILRLENLAANTHRAPGDPPVTAEEAFRRFLASDSSKIYKNGVLLGRGIRFSLRPSAWSETSCAERIWRVTTSLQMLGTLNNARLTLMQENAFASQECRAEERGALHVARIRPFHNLLVGDNAPSFENPSRYTAMNVDGLVRTRSEMEALVEGRHEGFAGRGLYGNYILLFPSGQFTPAVLANLKDVLIRFDIVEVTNVTL